MITLHCITLFCLPCLWNLCGCLMKKLSTVPENIVSALILDRAFKGTTLHRTILLPSVLAPSNSDVATPSPTWTATMANKRIINLFSPEKSSRQNFAIIISKLWDYFTNAKLFFNDSPQKKEISTNTIQMIKTQKI